MISRITFFSRRLSPEELQPRFFFLLKAVAMAALLTGLAGNCRDERHDVFSLKIVPASAELFFGIIRDHYSESETSDIFSLLDAKSIDYCLNPNLRSEWRKKISQTTAGEYPDEFQNPGLAAVFGCRNWYKLARFDAFGTFSEAETLASGNANSVFTCVATGLMEPYMMAGILNCDQLYIVNADFRILKVHAEILKGLKFSGVHSASALISKIQVRFIQEGSSTPDPNLHNITFENLCGEAHADECRYYLTLFAANWSNLKKIQLILGRLDEALPEVSNEGYPLMVYVKHGIDSRYMPEAAFDRFLKAVAYQGGGTIIYRRRGEIPIAVYSVSGKASVKTLCADTFQTYVPEHYSADRRKIYFGKLKRYSNYFDEVTLSRQITPCTEEEI